MGPTAAFCLLLLLCGAEAKRTAGKTRPVPALRADREGKWGGGKKTLLGVNVRG